MTAVRRKKKNLNISAQEMRRVAGDTMREHFGILKGKGKARAAKTPEEFYGFHPEDVVEMHSRKHGTGSGVWYRLKDGRVIDALGRPSENERAWYVASAH